MEKDHLEIILEDIREKFDMVLEGHSALHQKIDTVYRDLSEKIEDNSFKIGVLNRKIDDVDKRLSKKIDDVDKRLSKKIDDVDKRLSKKIDGVDKRLSKKIDDVDKRLSKKIDDVDKRLSKKIDDVDKRLSKKIDEVGGSLREEINRVEQKVDAVAADLAAHRADTESHGKGYIVSE